MTQNRKSAGCPLSSHPVRSCVIVRNVCPLMLPRYSREDIQFFHILISLWVGRSSLWEDGKNLFGGKKVTTRRVARSHHCGDAARRQGGRQNWVGSGSEVGPIRHVSTRFWVGPRSTHFISLQHVSVPYPVVTKGASLFTFSIFQSDRTAGRPKQTPSAPNDKSDLARPPPISLYGRAP